MWATFWSPYREIFVWPNYDSCDGQFKKYCQTLYNPRSLLVLWYLPSEGYFGALTVKLWVNPITAQKMANLQNTLRRLKIIVLSLSYGAYHQRDILELSLWNSRSTPLWPKRWPIQSRQTVWDSHFLFMSSIWFSRWRSVIRRKNLLCVSFTMGSERGPFLCLSSLCIWPSPILSVLFMTNVVFPVSEHIFKAYSPCKIFEIS